MDSKRPILDRIVTAIEGESGWIVLAYVWTVIGAAGLFAVAKILEVG